MRLIERFRGQTFGKIAYLGLSLAMDFGSNSELTMLPFSALITHYPIRQVELPSLSFLLMIEIQVFGSDNGVQIGPNASHHCWPY